MENVNEKISAEIIIYIGLIICSIAVICFNCMFIYKQVIERKLLYYSDNSVLSIVEGTYKSSDGHSISVDSTGKILYEDTYTLNLTSNSTGNKISGKIGSSNTSVTLYQISSTTMTMTSAVTYTDSDGNSILLDNYTSFVLENSTPVVDDSGIYEVWNNGSKVNTYSDLQSAVDAADAGSTIKITKDFIANAGVYINKNITIDGCNNEMDKSSWFNASFVIESGATVNINNLIVDGGATGFTVDYDGVTYTNYVIPLVSGSNSDDPKSVQSTIITKGNLTTDNFDVNNVYTTSNGAAFFIVGGKTTINNGNFTHNYAGNYGGVIYSGINMTSASVGYPVEELVINNCIFDDNYTKHGGALYAYNTETVKISNSDFYDNVANGGKGGAVCLATQNTTSPYGETLGLPMMKTYIDNSTFDGNWAGNDGFAIQTYDSDLYMSNCVVKNNVGVHPTSSVGAISVEAYRAATKIIFEADNCEFIDNIGPASVYGDHNSICDTTFTNCLFSGNTGNESLLLYSSTTIISDCKFVNEHVATTVIDNRIYANHETLANMTMTDTTFVDTDGPTDILIRSQGHNLELDAYVVTFNGVNNANVTILDDNNLVVNGVYSGDIVTDSNTGENNISISDDAVVTGNVTYNTNTYTIIFMYSNGSGKLDGEILYLEKNKTYTEAEIYLMFRAAQEGKKLELYTDSGYTTLWDYTASSDMSIYAKWVDHEHSYNEELVVIDSGIYEQCDCGYFEKGIVLTLPDNLTYDGNEKGASITNDLGIDENKYSVVYLKKGSDGKYKQIDTTPVEAGYYMARLSYEDLVVEKEFEILEKIESPDTSDNVMVYVVIAVISVLVIGLVIGYLLIQKKKNKIL